jgi:broad specificity phosphatase PhoE
MSVLVLVRHGETDANRDGLLLGRADPPLNTRGREQVARLAAWLGAGTAPLAVLTSPLRRARETASAIAATWGVEVAVEERLVEVDYGDLDGVRLGTLSADVVSRWRTDPHFAPVGGESLAGVRARVAAFAQEVFASLADGPVIAVSHVSPIKAAVLWALDLPDLYAWRMHLDLGSATRLIAGPTGAVLLAFNEVPEPRGSGGRGAR